MTAGRDEDQALASRVHRAVTAVLLGILSAELALAVVLGQWMAAALVGAILATMAPPLIVRRLVRVHIPPEFAVLAILFLFASLYLGEVRDFYTRFWWWDIALHAGSGLLLGIAGFLLVFVLNESASVDLHLSPRFVAIFAFCFALAGGAVWEIFEFAMDRLAGTTMQKPMLGDPSGLTDTMWDLIVDAAGALAISVFGWWFLRSQRESFIESWTRRFIEANPRLFRS